METNKPNNKVEEIVEEFSTVFDDLAEFNVDRGLSEQKAEILKNDWEEELRQALTSSYEQGVRDTEEKVKNYQHGFIRDDGTGEPERAPEWQVIEDLLQSLKNN